MKRFIIAAAIVVAAGAACAQETFLHNRIVGTVKIGDEIITAVTYNRQDFADMDACRAFLQNPDEEYMQAKQALIDSIAHNHRVASEEVTVIFVCEKSAR